MKRTAGAVEHCRYAQSHQTAGDWLVARTHSTDFADPEAESALPACTDTTVFSTCTSEWSILSGLVLQLTLLSALAAPGLTTTMLSTLPV